MQRNEAKHNKTTLRSSALIQDTRETIVFIHQTKTKRNATKQRVETQQNATKCSETTRQSYATIHNAMTLLTNDVLARFIYKTLPIIDGQPTYADINKMSKILYVNVAKVPTTLGSGNKGHIRLVIKVSLYATILTTAYAARTEPTMPTNVSSTGAERQK
eukprot:11885910-Ditylum_brightwellii.AAC.1